MWLAGVEAGLKDLAAFATQIDPGMVLRFKRTMVPLILRETIASTLNAVQDGLRDPALRTPRPYGWRRVEPAIWRHVLSQRFSQLGILFEALMGVFHGNWDTMQGQEFLLDVKTGVEALISELRGVKLFEFVFKELCKFAEILDRIDLAIKKDPSSINLLFDTAEREAEAIADELDVFAKSIQLAKGYIVALQVRRAMPSSSDFDKEKPFRLPPGACDVDAAKKRRQLKRGLVPSEDAEKL